MTTLTLQPGLRPAPLPPTLQPHAVLSIAPPTDRRRSAALSGLVYAILAGGAVWMAHVGVRVIQPLPPVIGSLTLSEPGPQVPPAHATPATAVPPNPVAPVIERTPPMNPIDDLNTTATLPTQAASPWQPPLSPVVSTGGPGASGGLITLSGSSVRILHRVDPLYPPMAKVAHQQGRVVIRMTIDEHGNPTEVNALSGPEVFQGPALQAARQWRFVPALQNGEPVAATFLLTLNFVLR